ncbi:MAG: Rrf2 family transcriptional regulator [Mariprofundales bacterium]|nr:Rrf2 family transcriptional regulator [Mariprofundales bacterium]
MQISQYTDYALRILIALALQPEKRVKLHDIADAYGISYNHLVKVVGALHHRGLVLPRRGRNGGLMLDRDPAEINVGYVVREFESSMDLLECFDAETNSCPIAPLCPATGIFFEARAAFLAVLDRYSLADVIAERADGMRMLLGVPPV